MTKAELAKKVLIQARDGLISELAMCGQNGGTGRANSYAPVLVNICAAIDYVDGVVVEEAGNDVKDRMAAVRAAKTKAE